MKLQPLTQLPAVSYPERKARLFLAAGRWIRRVGAVACAATLLGAAGCGYRAPGSAPMPDEFYCYGAQSSIDVLTTEGSFSGELCGGVSVTGNLQVSEEATLRITFYSSDGDLGGGDATVDIVDPDGAVVATATNVVPAELTVTPGAWQAIVVPANTDDRRFGLTIAVITP